MPRASAWNDRGHFLAVAAKVMRHILIDYARTRGRLKRGGNQLVETLDDDMLAVARDAERLLDIDRALERLDHCRSAARPPRRMPLLRRPERTGNSRCARALAPHRPTRLAARPRRARAETSATT